MSDRCGWDVVNAWVAAHRDSLPRTLEELAKYPIAYRRAIQGAVAADVRAAFWCDHLRSFLGPGTELSPDQQAFVEETIAKMPAMSAAPRIKAQEMARELEMRMVPLFSREQAFRIFAHLGPLEPPEGLAPPS
jgi:hypothetical protein